MLRSDTGSKTKHFLLFLILSLMYSLIFYDLGQILRHLNQANLLDINELWNQTKVNRILNGLSIYPAVSSSEDATQRYLMMNNYPPLSFYLIAGLYYFPGFSKLSILFLGRLVSLFSIFVSTFFIGLLSQKIAPDLEDRPKYLPAFISVTLFLLFNAGILNGYFAVYDPQWTAEAISLAGLTVLFLNPAFSWAIISASFLLVIAGFFKHNLVIAPLAVTLWMFLFQRRSLPIWLLSAVLFVSSGLLLCYFLFGSEFFHSVIAYELDRKHSFAYFRHHKVDLFLILCLLFSSECLVLFSRGRFYLENKELLFWHLFAFIGIVIGLWGAMSDQCDVNVFFDALIGVSILGGFSVLAQSSALSRAHMRQAANLHLRFCFLTLAPFFFSSIGLAVIFIQAIKVCLS